MIKIILFLPSFLTLALIILTVLRYRHFKLKLLHLHQLFIIFHFVNVLFFQPIIR